MTSVFQTKGVSEPVSDIDRKQGIITGYLSAFNNVDSDNDIVQPGAFKKTIIENGPTSPQPRIKFLLNHSTTQPIGRFLELKEDSHGLRYTAQIGKHNQGQDFLKMAEDGLISEHSIGFKSIAEEKGKTGPRYLKEIKLWEGSALTAWGSNSRTPVVSIKSYADAAERIDKITRSFRDSDYSDETFSLLEIELKQIQQVFLNATQAAKAPEPDELAMKEIHNINNYFKKILK
ncbi:MAG: HK97 family phage prohead protease [Mucilaginibacter sp.]